MAAGHHPGGPHVPGTPEVLGRSAGGLWGGGLVPGGFMQRTLLRGPDQAP